MVRSARRGGAALLLAGLLLGLAWPAAAGPTEPITYRYWTYWWGIEGRWTYAPAGLAHAVADGDVEGWRYAAAPLGGTTTPRADPSFDDICADVPEADGSVRVALVVDFGDPADAPPGEQPPRGIDSRCVVVPAAGATGATVLSEYATVRQQNGVLCGIAGYPQQECLAPAHQDAPLDEWSWLDAEVPGVVGVALIGALSLTAAMRWRREPESMPDGRRGDHA